MEMFRLKRDILYHNYNHARDYFLQNPGSLIELEQSTTALVNQAIMEHYAEIEHDYNEASYLNAFWANYPPDDRGRAPKGDQIPWIEVGEHAVGHKLSRLISHTHQVMEIGLPSGADNRFVLVDPRFLEITEGQTDRVFVFLDIKSVGPRDNFDHIVVSPYQVSGDGIWDTPENNMKNSTMLAIGARAKHTFYPAISPIYAFTDGTIAPTIHLFVKPVYRMLNTMDPKEFGQPLESIKNICVPNGLLLCKNPDYLSSYPGLLYPGKDDKGTNPQKMRARVSFPLLCEIANWRVTEDVR